MIVAIVINHQKRPFLLFLDGDGEIAQVGNSRNPVAANVTMQEIFSEGNDTKGLIKSFNGIDWIPDAELEACARALMKYSPKCDPAKYAPSDPRDVQIADLRSCFTALSSGVAENLAGIRNELKTWMKDAKDAAKKAKPPAASTEMRALQQTQQQIQQQVGEQAELLASLSQQVQQLLAQLPPSAPAQLTGKRTGRGVIESGASPDKKKAAGKAGRPSRSHKKGAGKDAGNPTICMRADTHAHTLPASSPPPLPR